MILAALRSIEKQLRLLDMIAGPHCDAYVRQLTYQELGEERQRLASAIRRVEESQGEFEQLVAVRRGG